MIRILWSAADHPLSPQAWQRLLALLPVDLQDSVLRFKRWQDQQTALLGKLLLRQGLLETGYTGDLLRHWRTHPHGKPFLPLPIHFNLSHTHGLVVCALTRAGELGVDLEQIRPIELADFRRMLPPASWRTITTAHDPCQAFFECWTRCESVVKADGRGLSIPFHSLLIEPNCATLSGASVPDSAPARTWYTHPIPLLPGYCCHLATTHSNPTFAVQRIDPESIQ
ncbi:MAG: 4'-phosphopantetheinyl transferase superfamily protein [Magnetococcales bacterium]|nr:4'-phosphopantetheinyl transferase superfamily protein [Magnetococcales bacterium]